MWQHDRRAKLKTSCCLQIFEQPSKNPFWYYGGYDAFGARTEASRNLPELEPNIKQDGLDEKTETTHLLEACLSFKLAKFLAVGAKFGRVQTDVSGDYVRLNNYNDQYNNNYRSSYLNAKNTGATEYAGAHGTLPVQNDMAFRFRFEYQKSTVDLANGDAVVDTSYNHYRFRNYPDNVLYNYISSSRFTDSRIGEGMKTSRAGAGLSAWWCRCTKIASARSGFLLNRRRARC